MNLIGRRFSSTVGNNFLEFPSQSIISASTGVEVCVVCEGEGTFRQYNQVATYSHPIKCSVWMSTTLSSLVRECSWNQR